MTKTKIKILKVHLFVLLGLSPVDVGYIHRRQAENFREAYSMDIVDNIRGGYRVLEDRVNTALHTQLGDAERLTGIRSEAIHLAETIEMVNKMVNTTLIGSKANFNISTV